MALARKRQCSSSASAKPPAWYRRQENQKISYTSLSSLLRWKWMYMYHWGFQASHSSSFVAIVCYISELFCIIVNVSFWQRQFCGLFAVYVVQRSMPPLGPLPVQHIASKPSSNRSHTKSWKIAHAPRLLYTTFQYSYHIIAGSLKKRGCLEFFASISQCLPAVHWAWSMLLLAQLEVLSAVASTTSWQSYQAPSQASHCYQQLGPIALIQQHTLPTGKQRERKRLLTR